MNGNRSNVKGQSSIESYELDLKDKSAMTYPWDQRPAEYSVRGFLKKKIQRHKLGNIFTRPKNMIDFHF